MAPKATTTKAAATTTTTTTTHSGPEAGMNAAFAARFAHLYDTRFYKAQTEQDLWATIINAGIKAIEKRRKGTTEAQIERAEATLAKFGRGK